MREMEIDSNCTVKHEQGAEDKRGLGALPASKMACTKTSQQAENRAQYVLPEQ